MNFSFGMDTRKTSLSISVLTMMAFDNRQGSFKNAIADHHGAKKAALAASAAVNLKCTATDLADD